MSCLFLFYKYIAQISPAVITDNLMHHFNLHATGLATLVAAYFPAYLLVQFLSGPLLDHFSVRKVSTVAIFLISISLYGFSHTQSLWEAYCWRAMMGAGASFATISYLKLAALWFSDQQYAFVAGWLATAASVGGMIAQTPVAYGVEHLGWEHTLSLCSLLGVVIMGCYFIFVNDNNQQQVKSNEKNDPPEKDCDFSSLFQSKRLWLLALYSGLAWAPMAVFCGLWGDSYLQLAFHLSKSSAANLISVSFLGLALGGPWFGWVAQRSGAVYKTMFVGLVVSLVGLSSAVYLPSSNLSTETVSLFLFGFGTGAFMLGFFIGKRWFSLSLAATVVAVVNSGDALFGAVSEPMVGKVLDMLAQHHVVDGAYIYELAHYHIAFSLLLGYLMAAMFCLRKLSSYQH